MIPNRITNFCKRQLVFITWHNIGHYMIGCNFYFILVVEVLQFFTFFENVFMLRTILLSSYLQKFKSFKFLLEISSIQTDRISKENNEKIKNWKCEWRDLVHAITETIWSWFKLSMVWWVAWKCMLFAHVETVSDLLNMKLSQP